MNLKATRIMQLSLIALSSLAMLETNASNIDPSDKYAWSENAGWVNFLPSDGGATVYDDHLEGFVWSENVGWIRLGGDTGGGTPNYYANDSSSNYGVNNDGAGNLSGYAWSENVGWINFYPTHSQVTIDPSTGDFDGYAWAENVGWIHFQNASYKVSKTNMPPVADAGENLIITTEQQCGTVIEGSAYDPDNDPLEYRWLEGLEILLGWSLVGENGEADLDLCDILLNIGQHTLTLEVNDSQVTSSDEMILTIDNSAPNAAPTGTGTYQLGSTITVGGQVSDFDNDELIYTWSKELTDYCSDEVQAEENSPPGTPVTLPDCVLPPLELGTHTITLTVSDGINDPVSEGIESEVMDTTQPTLNPTANKTILWPPNHKMVDIIIDTHASDNSGMPSLSAVVMSNEPQEGLGDGDMAPDWTEPVIEQETGIITLQLRAERSGSGDGRTYSIAITATDPSSNSSTANLNIIVPHDKGK